MILARHAGPARQRGAGAVEFVIIMVLFATLITGLFEMTRVFRSKHTLGAATFMAARIGAVHNARLAPMNAELSASMAELFMAGGQDPAQLAAAKARAASFGAAQAQHGGGVAIVSPSRSAFGQLRKEQWVWRTDEDEFRVQEVIPNDNLRWRPREVAHIGGAEINLQDANLLKIRSLWCHRLVVPGLDRLVHNIVSNPPFVTERQQVCMRVTTASRVDPAIPEGFYLAVSGKAILRMQSPVVEDDLP